MRGIEAALKVLNENKIFFASEALRKLADREKMKAPDISLASSLIYIVMRRRELWEKITANFLHSKEKLPGQVYTAILTGAGGLLELRRFSKGILINGIVESLKRDRSLNKYISLVNAVLRKINEGGEELINKFKHSTSLEERAMFAGIPVKLLPAWIKTWTRSELFELFDMFEQPSYSAVRLSEGGAVMPEGLKLENNPLASKLALSPLTGGARLEGLKYQLSDISQALRLNESVLPVTLPGFAEGLCTVQNESSILAASLVKKFYSGKGLILDMCSGRGVKAGQILQENPASKIECWELSEKRSESAANELERLGVKDRAALKTGDALNLEPLESPSFVMLDAPCSGAGTWNRKPESKWKLDWKKFDSIVAAQKKLLDRALTLCAPGGYVLYITCSLLKHENENVIAEVLASHVQDCTEVSGLIDWKGSAFKKGKPYGFYILPVNPWLDGFYCSLILKR
ncbi:MAG: RsmB/NOP family class I SAM-dependent RNA methyltransferase [Synergistaceae bacterium]|nr:RsmB/NOP family class I SAM-dependent RNA methyltransferase [Synergistaceae bacterium]